MSCWYDSRIMQLSEFLLIRDIKQTAFAVKIGVRQPTVSRWAAGRMPQKRKHLRLIRKVTGGAVTADDFVDDKPRRRRAV
jgi:DNA-binding transcriptional regulator YdaS (Cro superfamily)